MTNENIFEILEQKVTMLLEELIILRKNNLHLQQENQKLLESNISLQSTQKQALDRVESVIFRLKNLHNEKRQD